MQPFLDWVIEYLVTSEPQHVEGWALEDIDERVRFACESALQLRLAESVVMLRFVLLVLELGPALHRDEQVRAILHGPGGDKARLDAITGDAALLERLRALPPRLRWNGFHSRHDLPTHD
jgi:hypothetical protein